MQKHLTKSYLKILNSEKKSDTHAHTPSPDRALCPAFLSEHRVVLLPVDETVPTESAAHSQTPLYTTDRKTKWIETLVGAENVRMAAITSEYILNTTKLSLTVQKEHFFKQPHNSRVQEVKIPINLCTKKKSIHLLRQL